MNIREGYLVILIDRCKQRLYYKDNEVTDLSIELQNV